MSILKAKKEYISNLGDARKYIVGPLTMSDWTAADAWWNNIRVPDFTKGNNSVPDLTEGKFKSEYYASCTPKLCECGQKGVEWAIHSDYCPLYDKKPTFR